MNETQVAVCQLSIELRFQRVIKENDDLRRRAPECVRVGFDERKEKVRHEYWRAPKEATDYHNSGDRAGSASAAAASHGAARGTDARARTPGARARTRVSAEPIIGWRCWRWSPREGALYSTIYGVAWPRLERLESRCLSEDDDRPICLHSPMQDCTCGVYAWSDRKFLDRIIKLEPGGFPVWGQVSLWGRIVECEKGWRAQYAYPYSLLVTPSHADEVKVIRDRYLVDVDVLG